MHIAYYCHDYRLDPNDGGRVFVRTLAHRLVAEGHRVTVIGFGRDAGRFQDSGVTVIKLRVPWFRHPIWVRFRLRRLMEKFIREQSVDLLEIPDYDGWFPFQIRGCAVCIRLHLTGTANGLHTGRPTHGWRTWCEGRQLRVHENWVGVSQFAIDDTSRLFKLRPTSARVIYSPIEHPQCANEFIVPPYPYVLYAGAATARKGAFAAAVAANRFLRVDTKLRLVYVGRADEWAKGQILQRVQPELHERIVFPGVIPKQDVRNYMRHASVFLFPSSKEYLGAVCVEAMLAGAPVVVGDNGVSSEFAVHETHGLLVDPLNTDTIADAVERLLLDRPYALAIAARGKARVEKQFKPGDRIRENIEYYVALVEQENIRTPRKQTKQGSASSVIETS